MFTSCDLFTENKFPKAFYAWIGTVLRQESVRKDAVIYREGDQPHEIFFVQKGLVGYFLPRYRSYFAVVEPGDRFGHLDFRLAEDDAQTSSDNEDEDMSTQ